MAKAIYVEVTVKDENKIGDIADFIEEEIRYMKGSYKVGIDNVEVRVREKEKDWKWK